MSLTLAILGVSVGTPAPLGRWGDADIVSGIRKAAVDGGDIEVTTINLAGDGQADLSVHGGVDKAVYAYPSEHADWWIAQGVTYRAGFMGENLTLAGADETQVRIGDRFSWGPVVLEVSQPRAPCFKLAMLTGRPDAPGLMTRSGYCGWYLRVLTPGVAAVAGALVRTWTDPAAPSVREATFATSRADFAPSRLRDIAAHPALSQSWRDNLSRAAARRSRHA